MLWCMAPKRKLTAQPAQKPKLHGLRRPLAITLPPELVDALDIIAQEEDRTRVKMIEIACRHFAQSYQRKAAA